MLPGDVASIINLTGFITWGMLGLVMVAHIVFKFKKDTKDIPRLVRVTIKDIFAGKGSSSLSSFKENSF